ncbi:MAG: DUF5717 family protein [Lachnospiraceae bacterium]|nr:DUF5717 family protein [Lachnospiraceae bacterium]
MSEDKFENQTPQLSLSSDKIEITGIEGTKISDEFTIVSVGDIPVKGLVYSSNPYVKVVKPQFEGVEIVVRYEVKGSKLLEGDHIDGYFTIMCNKVERRLPFDIKICAKSINSSIGEINSLDDFANLAKGHWNEAMSIFYSKSFEEYVSRGDNDLQLLYIGFRKAVPSSVNMEEFLVSASLKQPVTFNVEERFDEFYEVRENRKETIEITKNTWGYIEIDVQSDSDFVTVENQRVTSDYFLGGYMEFNYYIHKDKMHAGKNYCRITFECKGIIKTVEIMATADTKEDSELSSVKAIDYRMVQISNLYKEYRFRRITTGDWCSRTIAILDDIIKEDPKVWFYQLMRTQCLIVNKQRQEALWAISDLKKDITDKGGEDWAYLLYLCTLIEREESYVDRLTHEIEMIFRANPENPRIFWFLSFLRKEYIQNNNMRLKAIEQWIEAGYDSPYLYLEVLEMYIQDPYLLHDFNPFAVKILYWTAKHNAFPKDLCIQIAHAVENASFFSEKIWSIIVMAYEIYPDEKFLLNMISYLIKNQAYGEKYLPWYKLGVQQELKLNGLYEAYMLSLPDESTEALPQMLLMYFQYSCSLPDNKRALLYANVISNKKAAPQLYEVYLRSMELFMIEQLKHNRISDNLAIIYQDILGMGIIHEQIADAVAGMIYMKKVVILYPDITRVFLYQEQYEMPIVVSVVNHAAFLPIISDKYRIFLETNRGEMLTDTKAYILQQVMYTPKYLDKLIAMSPLSMPYILFDLEHKKTADDFKIEDVDKLEILMDSSLVSRKYIRNNFPIYVEFLQNHFREDLLEKYFSKEENVADLDVSMLGFMISMYISKGHFKQVNDLLRTCPAVEVDNRLLLQFCNEWILNNEFERDEFIVSLSGRLFENNTYNTTTLTYLSNQYVGGTEIMINLWKACKREDMQVRELEENILFQALYAESCVSEVCEIFDSYMTRGKDRMLIEAYINYWSYKYMLGCDDVSEHLFTYLAYYFDKELDVKESCNLAYMKYLSTAGLLSDREYKILDRLLKKYIRNNIYFAFYKDIDERLIVKYHLYDKQFVEYRGNPGERVNILYRINNGDTIQDIMYEMYEGIFVKQFVIFFGEVIEYEIFSEGMMETPEYKAELTVSSDEDGLRQDRYDMINHMQNMFVYGENIELARDMKKYQGLDTVTKSLFTIV